MSDVLRWAWLLLLSCFFAALLNSMGLPAGLLLGPMIAAILFAARGAELSVHPLLWTAGQAGIALMITPALNPSVLGAAAHDPWIFIGGTLATLAISAVVGWLLAFWKVLPGSVAIWGSMPGAATAMVVMARDEGAEWQLVAVMSYLRVLLIAALASALAASMAGPASGHVSGAYWFPKLDGVALIETIAIGVAGAYGGTRIGLPAAALLGPMILGVALEASGLAQPQLPRWLLAPAYFLVGWRIGTGFTPEIVRTAARSAPRIAIAIATLVVLCAIAGEVLSRLSGIDPVSTYLAMSPGGADSIAIIASTTHVDVPFVMSMQILRFVAVLIVGPGLARWAARRFRSSRLD